MNNPCFPPSSLQIDLQHGSKEAQTNATTHSQKWGQDEDQSGSMFPREHAVSSIPCTTKGRMTANTKERKGEPLDDQGCVTHVHVWERSNT